MEQFEYKGVIEFEDNDGKRLYLYDVDGSRYDLVEVFETFDCNEVQVNYYITDNPCTKNEMLEGLISKLSGSIYAEYEDYYTGSWTYGSSSSWGNYEYRGVLMIGGHDLFYELSHEDGKFMIMDIYVK